MNLLFLGRVFTLIALFSLSVNVFAASPRINYLLYCTGCHAANGAGKPPNVPSLRDELGRMISVPEMRSYLVRIPGASQAPISDADLTDVINWLLREFNSNTLPANFEEYTVGEVSDARRNILADPLRYRAEYWKSYDD
jgi:hypothetical protein